MASSSSQYPAVTLGPRATTSPTAPGGHGVPAASTHVDRDPDDGLPDRPERAAVEEPLLVGEARDDRRRLGGAVVLVELGVGERLVGVADDGGRDRRAGVADQPQRRHVARTGPLLGGQGGEHRRHRHVHGDPVMLDRVQARRRRRTRAARRAIRPARSPTAPGRCRRRGRRGRTARNTSLPRSSQAMVLWNELATRLRWVSWTPLGRPVVPPVKYRTARSSSLTPAPRGAGPARRRRARPTRRTSGPARPRRRAGRGRGR